jgi:hypothetical protein
MAVFIRTLVFVLSITSVAFAAESWSFSDGTLSVGPKGKDATASYVYIPLQFQIDEQIALVRIQKSKIPSN